MKSTATTVLAALSLATVGAGVATADVIPNLGSAEGFAVLGFEQVDMTISSGNTIVTGDVGYGVDGTLDFSGGGLITGRLFHHLGQSTTYNLSGGSSVSDGIFAMDMVNPVLDARNASAVAAGKSADQVVASLGAGDLINAAGAVTTIDVTGDLSISSGTLTINVADDQLVILNISGDMRLSGGSLIDIVGGGSAANVLYNILGSGDRVEFNGDSTVNGTVLAADRNITIAGGVVNGAILGAGFGEFKLQSGPEVNYVALVPAPSTISLACGVGLLAARRRRA